MLIKLAHLIYKGLWTYIIHLIPFWSTQVTTLRPKKQVLNWSHTHSWALLHIRYYRWEVDIHQRWCTVYLGLLWSNFIHELLGTQSYPKSWCPPWIGDLTKLIERRQEDWDAGSLYFEPRNAKHLVNFGPTSKIITWPFDISKQPLRGT